MDQILSFFNPESLGRILYAISIPFSVFIGFFLYWRGGRHELHETKFLLDVSLVCSFGGLIFARLAAFLFDFEYFNFSVFRLIFFHIFPGFSMWGFLLGILIIAFIYLYKSKEDPFHLYDLAVSAFIFSSLVFYLWALLISIITDADFNLKNLAQVLFYLLFFFVLKRLSTKKRHKGFFTGLYFLGLGIFYTLFFLFENWRGLNLNLMLKENFAMPLVFALIGSIILYKFSKRRLRDDLKGFFALMLLNIFKARRVVVSADEAGRIAKSLILLPYFIFRVFLVLLRMFAKELTAAYWEFLYILGLRKY